MDNLPVNDTQDIYRCTVRRAVDLSGELEDAASELGVSKNHLALWMEGRGRIPMETFLKAVDLLERQALTQPSARKR
jgi:transcriptional regulator with XRE-family HTH domain